MSVKVRTRDYDVQILEYGKKTNEIVSSGKSHTDAVRNALSWWGVNDATISGSVNENEMKGVYLDRVPVIAVVKMINNKNAKESFHLVHKK